MFINKLRVFVGNLVFPESPLDPEEVLVEVLPPELGRVEAGDFLGEHGKLHADLVVVHEFVVHLLLEFCGPLVVDSLLLEFTLNVLHTMLALLDLVVQACPLVQVLACLVDLLLGGEDQLGAARESGQADVVAGDLALLRQDSCCYSSQEVEVAHLRARCLVLLVAGAGGLLRLPGCSRGLGLASSRWGTTGGGRCAALALAFLAARDVIMGRGVDELLGSLLVIAKQLRCGKQSLANIVPCNPGALHLCTKLGESPGVLDQGDPLQEVRTGDSSDGILVLSLLEEGNDLLHVKVRSLIVLARDSHILDAVLAVAVLVVNPQAVVQLRRVAFVQKVVCVGSTTVLQGICLVVETGLLDLAGSNTLRSAVALPGGLGKHNCKDSSCWYKSLVILASVVFIYCW